jgi:hypothetical protein
MQPILAASNTQCRKKVGTALPRYLPRFPSHRAAAAAGHRAPYRHSFKGLRTPYSVLLSTTNRQHQEKSSIGRSKAGMAWALRKRQFQPHPPQTRKHGAGFAPSPLGRVMRRKAPPTKSTYSRTNPKSWLFFVLAPHQALNEPRLRASNYKALLPTSPAWAWGMGFRPMYGRYGVRKVHNATGKKLMTARRRRDAAGVNQDS